MAGPWEKYAAPAAEGPWTRYGGSAAPAAPTPPPPPMPAPKPGDSWTDQGGNTFQIIEPTASRGFGQLTPADVQSRMAVRPLAQPPQAATGPSQLRPYTERDRATSAAVAGDPGAVNARLAAEPTQEGKALATRLMGQAQGVVQGPGQTFVRETANTALLGLPRMVEAATGPHAFAVGHELAKASDASARQANPKAAMAGQAAGMATQVLGTPLAAVSTPGRAAAFGAGMSGASTAIETRGDPAATVRDAATGAVTGYGLTRATGAVRQARAAPATNDELRTAAQNAYARADAAGVVFTPASMQRLGGTIVNDLASFGYHPNLQPRVAVVLGEIDRLSQGNTTLQGVDILRRMADNLRSSQERSERALGRAIIGHIDDLVTNPQRGDVLTGNAREGASALLEARHAWRRLSKADAIDDAVARARRQSERTGSNGNIDNAMRQKISAILDNPNRARGFTAEERAAMERIVRGGRGQDALRLIGKLSPSGNGLMMALQSGAAGASGGMTLPAAAVGFLAKRTSDRATERRVNALADLIRGPAPGQTGLPRISASSQRQLEQARALGLLASVPSNQNALAEIMRAR